jgi:hypothetical protein
MVLTSLPKIDRCGLTNLKNDIVEKRKSVMAKSPKVDAVNCKGFARRQFV